MRPFFENTRVSAKYVTSEQKKSEENEIRVEVDIFILIIVKLQNTAVNTPQCSSRNPV